MNVLYKYFLYLPILIDILIQACLKLDMVALDAVWNASGKEGVLLQRELGHNHLKFVYDSLDKPWCQF